MRILVMSDSHGNTANMLFAASKENPDMILHLGDHYTDCHILRSNFSNIPIRSVKGNCDHFGEQESLEFMCENIQILMTHGHRFNVKNGLDSLMTYAGYKSIDLVLYGHTHKPFHVEYNCIHMINPGSIGGPNPSYCMITLNGENISWQFKYI